MKELILFIICCFLFFAIRSCQCNMRAGNGISSHYNLFWGCVFEQKD